MRIRIVVASQAEASFYDLAGRDAALQPVGHLSDPKAHLHDRDFKSDRPGRVFNSGPTGGRRRGATARHGTGGERSPRKHEAELFAHQIAEALEQALHQDQFERVVLMAAPGFLGLLREALSKAVSSRVVAESPKDLVKNPTSDVLAHVPPAAFRADFEAAR
ncbi:MAG TPA: host attachment protein [Steroidobacteraceae bacterium]|nr:host attachment protein [Steroidobacteraceae bacterium]